MENTILKVLEEINEELLEYDGEDMIEDGIVNSFTFIGLVSSLEDEFGIDIDEEYLTSQYFGNKNRIIETIKKIIG